MKKYKPSRGNSYTAGSCCSTNIVIKNKESKINLDSGDFCTCFGEDNLDKASTKWKEKLMPIEGIKFRSASQDMHPLEIYEEELIFPHPAASIRLNAEFFVMYSCTSKYFIFGDDDLNIYVIDPNNHKDRYFKIGENKRQKFSFPLERKVITVLRQVNNVNKKKFVADKFLEAKISPGLTLEIKEDLIKILLQHREAFSSDNKPLRASKGHEVENIINVGKIYPSLLIKTAYQASPRAREES
ncbi:hypothetical protein O181_000144 [Austropuccinia psidii MF-1]|uniref:Uncharacterized protein n=1 Tax=Austropuccinia psidii MF-1 TaxID=1389203 RepID=A0A9Q3B814_9BASI|nr:hypothetical protein [Austropuccinia psidii MF-1]